MKYAGPLALVAVIGLVAYLIYKAVNKQASAANPLQPLFDFGDLLSSAGNQTAQFLSQYEFSTDDQGNVDIPTM